MKLLSIIHYRQAVCDTTFKTIPKKKTCRKAQWLSEEALQIAVKRREANSKGEKERYKHLNAEFQRLEISSRKLEIPREHSCKDGFKGQKWYGPNRRRRY